MNNLQEKSDFFNSFFQFLHLKEDFYKTLIFSENQLSLLGISFEKLTQEKCSSPQLYENILSQIQQNKSYFCNIQPINNFLDFSHVANYIFYLRSLVINFSLYSRYYEEFNRFSVLSLNKDFSSSDELLKVFEENTTLLDKIENDITSQENKNNLNVGLNSSSNILLSTLLKSYFNSSQELICLNNNLLSLAKYYEEHFIKNLENISFTDKTKAIQPYLEKHPNILSLFLNIGMPSEEQFKVLQEFKNLHFNHFIAHTIYEDELFNYLAVVYNLNEIIKIISYFLPKMILKE